MFCRQCGCEISNEAKFCNFCGTKTVAPKPQKDKSDNCPDANKPAGGKNDTSTNEKPAIPLPDCTEANRESSGANEKDDENGEAHRGCDTSKQTAEGTANAPEASNLKAAVAQNKKRSRRRMPMILLVALALALATSVAYAAYRAYTDIWAPLQQEQQQKAQAEKDAQEAQDAYNGIIEEYSKALKDAKNGELDRNEIAEKYPHVNSEPFPYYSMSLSDSETSDYKYTAKDLNDDGTPELLIGRDMTQYGTIYTSIAVYDIWSYQNGNLVHVESGITRGDYSLRENGVIMSRANGGAYINGYMMMSLNKGKLYSVEDLDQANVTKAQGNWTNLEGISEERIDGTTRTSSDNPQVEYTKYADNSTVADSGTCTAEQFSSMLKDLFNKYPEDTSVEWKTIPTN